MELGFQNVINIGLEIATSKHYGVCLPILMSITYITEFTNRWFIKYGNTIRQVARHNVQQPCVFLSQRLVFNTFCQASVSDSGDGIN